MLKAILRAGVLVPLEPLPIDWEEGASLEVGKAASSSIDLDAWAQTMNDLCADSSSTDEEIMRRAIDEQQQRAKAQVRRDMGLPA